MGLSRRLAAATRAISPLLSPRWGKRCQSNRPGRLRSRRYGRGSTSLPYLPLEDLVRIAAELLHRPDRWILGAVWYPGQANSLDPVDGTHLHPAQRPAQELASGGSTLGR